MKSVQSIHPWQSVIQTKMLKFLLPLLLLAACTTTPKDDGTKPPSPFSPAKSWEANPKDDYKVNMLTGQPVEPITTVDGKTIPTGIPIPAVGKRINPDSIAPPKLLTTTPTSSTIKTRNNVYPVPDKLQQIPVDESKLIKHNTANSPQGYTIKNLLGGNTPTGKPIAAKGKTAKGVSPKIIPALPLRTNESALYDIQQLNIDQGLPNQFVPTLFQDNEGYLWIGFFNGGVSRYDGKTFVHYGKENGLLRNDVRCVFQDSKGNFWFGHRGGGASRFDGKTFTTFTKADGLAGADVKKIIEDIAGNIWMTTNGGVSKLVPTKDSAGGTITNYTTNEGLSNNDVTSMAEDKAGNLWFTTNGGGVNKFDGKSFIHFTKNEGLANDTVNCIMEDKVGSLWFGTRGGVSKLEGKTFVYFPLQSLLSNRLYSKDVNFIVEDKSGHIWFGTRWSGVVKYEGKNFIHITEDEGLSFNGIASNGMLIDRSGHLWIGTAGGGLNRLTTNYFQRFSKAEGMADNFISNVFRDSKDNLWFNSLRAINRYNDSLPHRSGDAGKAGLMKNIIQYRNPFTNSTYEDKNGNLWFGSVKYDGKYFYRFGRAEGISAPEVLTILQDRRGHFWFGGNGGGLTRYEPTKEGKQAAFFHFTENGDFFNGSVCSLEDKSGNLWFGHSRGITKYIPSKDGQSGSFIHFTAAEGLGGISEILEDKNGDFWFASQSGLIRYQASKKGHSGIFTLFTTDQGLISNSVTSIFEDKQGILWIGTLGGLSKYDGKTFQNFTKTEGLSINQISQIEEDKSGNLWVATLGGGANILEKDLLKPSQQSIMVRMRQLYINETVPDFRNAADSTFQNIKFDGVQAFENYPINPRIPFVQNHLSFQYAAVDVSTTSKIKYSFRLLGLDNKWSNPTAETKADYRNLPDGQFIFQVRAIGESGGWSKSFDYPFTILPPWWKTWWAYTIYAFLFLAALRAFSLWRERRLRKEKEQLQHKVEERTSELKMKSEELEHSLVDLKSTQSQLIQSEKMASLGELTAGIAHEIQNPLNFVNNFAEVSEELLQELKGELEKGDIDEAKAISDDVIQNLSKINHHGKRASDIVKGMLEHSRKSTGEKELTDINALCDEYLRLAYHARLNAASGQGLKAKDNSFNATMETHFDPNLPKIDIIPQDIGRVILNLINNAFYVVNERANLLNLAKQSGDANLTDLAYQPTVSITTQLTATNQIQISVKDNGNGIPAHIMDKIFQPFFTTKPTGQGTGLGLSLSYDIVKAHGGELKVETLPADLSAGNDVKAEAAAQAGKENEGQPGKETGSTFIIQIPV
jgi:signal transduction histidine kinase/ligand-binding sensor domain-containing protein